MPLHDTAQIERPMPPDTYPPIRAEQGGVSPVATGLAGLAAGAAATAAWFASKRIDKAAGDGGEDRAAGDDEKKAR
jgi:hypothetical protein